MRGKPMDFFEKFNVARKEFTYGDPEDMSRNHIQVGLVATFYIDQCYLPQKRQGMVEALKLYNEHFGRYFKWCYFDSKQLKPSEENLEKCTSYIQRQDDAIEFMFSSEESPLLHVGDYMVAGLSMQGWFEQVHKDLSYFRFYLPVEVLQGEGRVHFEKLLLKCFQLLKPLHGSAGLGMQVCYENEEFQDLEYDIAQEFNAIDIGSVLGEKDLRDGFRSINWYTILSDQLLAKLGGINHLIEKIDDERILLLPFETGVMVRAGDWPELGWIRENPYPELYVKVNELLKPARATEVGSFHFGSIEDEIRFDKETSNEWVRRFDNVEPIKVMQSID